MIYALNCYLSPLRRALSNSKGFIFGIYAITLTKLYSNEIAEQLLQMKGFRK